MQVKFSRKGKTLIAKISGELDHHSTEYFRQKIDSELLKAENKNLIMDLNLTGFMDSSGIGLIIGRYKKVLSINGKTAIVVNNSRITRILGLSGLGKLVKMFESLDDAVKALSEIS